MSSSLQEAVQCKLVGRLIQDTREPWVESHAYHLSPCYSHWASDWTSVFTSVKYTYFVGFFPLNNQKWNSTQCLVNSKSSDTIPGAVNNSCLENPMDREALNQPHLSPCLHGARVLTHWPRRDDRALGQSKHHATRVTAQGSEEAQHCHLGKKLTGKMDAVSIWVILIFVSLLEWVKRMATHFQVGGYGLACRPSERGSPD